jgi:hypothetical protein
MKLEILSPVDYPQWDEMVLETNEYSFFHSSSWATVLCESYNYKPAYFALVKHGKLKAVLPVMEVKSLLTGRRGVSLCFSDYCEPLIEDKEYFNVLLEHVISYGKKSDWKHIEFRGGQQYLSGEPESAKYFGHKLLLSQNDQELLSSFRDSTRRNINKARNAGVETKLCTTLQSVGEYYRLHCMTRKRHGLPPQPLDFFRNIYDYIISKKRGFVVLATHGGTTVAGAIYFHFGNKALYKFGASDDSYQHLRANNLVMWEAIKWYANNGYSTFCFGRSDCDGEGLRQFKNGWGTVERNISYYKYDIGEDKFVCANNANRTGCSMLFEKMPKPILQIAGQLLYRHMG